MYHSVMMKVLVDYSCWVKNGQKKKYFYIDTMKPISFAPIS